MPACDKNATTMLINGQDHNQHQQNHRKNLNGVMHHSLSSASAAGAGAVGGFSGASATLVDNSYDNRNVVDVGVVNGVGGNSVTEFPIRNFVDSGDDFSTSSILEFLKTEKQCQDSSEVDIESLFEEINRLSGADADDSDRTVEDILKEAELLLTNGSGLKNDNNNCRVNPSNGFMFNNNNFSSIKSSTVKNNKLKPPSVNNLIERDTIFSDGRSTTKIRDIKSTENLLVSSGSDLDCETKNNSHFTKAKELSRSIETLNFNPSKALNGYKKAQITRRSTPNNVNGIGGGGGGGGGGCIGSPVKDNYKLLDQHPKEIRNPKIQHDNKTCKNIESFDSEIQRPSETTINTATTTKALRRTSIDHCQSIRLSIDDIPCAANASIKNVKSISHQTHNFSETIHPTTIVNSNIPQTRKLRQRVSPSPPPSALPAPLSSQSQSQQSQAPRQHQQHHQIPPSMISSTSSIASSTSSLSSGGSAKTTTTTTLMSHSMSFSRERNLECELEALQEKLKDTEERLNSLRLQHDTLSSAHRQLRDCQSQFVDESDKLKLEVQHLAECANVLRNELKTARTDRAESIELQKMLAKELDESREEKKKALDQSERDVKTIQDLQRQCKEMERILMRKHPDSVSALIVASKNPTNGVNDSSASRRLLEQRIAQLEADARDQDVKAQQILANVQSRFSTVQCKYEQHIGDLETQVLSLQEINACLNEKITSQIEALRRNDEELAAVNNFTQTFDIPEKDTVETNCASTQTDRTNTANNTIPKTMSIRKSKSSSDSMSSGGGAGGNTNGGGTSSGNADAHLLATIRGMRVDLAIKEKAMQRLTRELEDCKKMIKKLQKENSTLRGAVATATANTQGSSSVSGGGNGGNGKKQYDPMLFSENNGGQNEQQQTIIKEYQNKIKLLEFDYNSLHDKRLQDLKTLQVAHERELASCKETVRILQQQLTERDEAFAVQKRRKVPIDYFALKAKVTSLERRHTEREQRLHILVEALSKGRLNGALEEMLNEQN